MARTLGLTHSKVALGNLHGIAVLVKCPCKSRSGTLSRWRTVGGGARSVDEDKKVTSLWRLFFMTVTENVLID